MDDLNIVDLYNKANDKRVSIFENRLNSNLQVQTDYDKLECDFVWLEMMENTIHYIDNILRNPNRFIINEEDIVKVELARRVTVESIKHLSRNTNLIQDIDKKTGDVKPSKILNINKEESFDTYENKFIYSLIQNMRSYINFKKRNLITTSSLSDVKKFTYTGNTNLYGEKVDINLSLTSSFSDKDTHKDEEGLDILSRIEKLELQISDLTTSEVYQVIDKKHISLVMSPIKKTNVILKNVNFGYALKLWNYMQEHMDDDIKKEHKKQNYNDNNELKNYMDEAFLLDYLVLDTLSSENVVIDKDEVGERIVGSMIQKMISLDENVEEEKIKDMITQQFKVIKYKTVVNEREIYKIFKTNMDAYLTLVSNIKI